jgi:putative membrane protein
MSAKETKEKTMEPTLITILPRLGSGLSVLLLHLLTTLALLALGALCYMGVTPFRERTLIATGNTAAGLVLAGTLIALAIPLAAMLATSHIWLDIVVWGLVAVILQLATFALAVVVFRNLRAMIEGGNVAAAAALVGVQIAVALLNAAAMAG